MNKYMNLNRLEFLITHKCSSKCRHCSNISEDNSSVLDLTTAENALKMASQNHNIESVMTFGGEPLLYPEVTFGIHKTAKSIGIPVRQIITNCYWTKDKDKISEIAEGLKASGVTEVLVSIDQFHQEFIPFETVMFTLKQLQKQNFDNLFINPCWYESPLADNEFDTETRNLLKEVSHLNIEVGEGNVMFPGGRATNNFPLMFKMKNTFNGMSCTDFPYCDSPDNITGICLNPNGKVNICGLGELDIKDFLNNYDPYKDDGMAAFLNNKYDGLLEHAQTRGVLPNKEGYHSLCSACKDLRSKLTN